MISNPRPGQPVQIWHATTPKVARLRYLPVGVTRSKIKTVPAGVMPWHGRSGIIVMPGDGRPRNHLIDVGGVKIVIPAGNLRSPK